MIDRHELFAVCRERRRGEYARNRKQFRKATDWMHRYFQEHEGATAEDCYRAAEKDGLDPITLFIVSVLATIALELFKVWWRSKGESE